MENIKAILVVLFTISGIFNVSALIISNDTAYIKYCIKVLAADSMGGRKPGTKNELVAADFIANQFRSNKIEPYQKQNYFQVFNYLSDSCRINSRNVIAYINNKVDKNIVIGAHYDHIGFGGKLSRSYGKHEVHNGADDNASGVALMLDLAKQLKIEGTKKYNYVFVAFSAHEDGLFGSSYFVKSNIIDSNSIKLMINFDMVGRASKDDPTLFIASNDSLFMKDAISVLANPLHIKAKDLPLGDHSVFALYHIPVLFFTTGMHDDYHKISDDAIHINYSSMNSIREYVLKYLRNL